MAQDLAVSHRASMFQPASVQIVFADCQLACLRSPHWWHPRVVYEDALVHVSVQQKMELADHAYTPKVKLPKVSFVEA